MVAEADEFDRSFLKMYPSIAVITNIEEDHLDCYRDLDDLLDSFAEYINRVPFYGSVVIPEFDANVRRIREGIKRPVVTFGFDPAADIRADDIEYTDQGSRFRLVVRGETRGHISLRIPGRYYGRRGRGHFLWNSRRTRDQGHIGWEDRGRGTGR